MKRTTQIQRGQIILSAGILLYVFYITPAYSGNVSASITDTGGKVGIGTVSPKNKLHVTVGSAGGNPTGSQENIILESNTNAYFTLLTPATAALTGYGFSTNTTTAKGGMFYAPSNDYLMFRTGQTERLRINNTGSIGIGTTGPTLVPGSSACNFQIRIMKLLTRSLD